MPTVLVAASPDSATPLVVLPVVEAFRARGHRVLFVGGEELRERAEALGAVVVPAPAVRPPTATRAAGLLPGVQQIDAHLRDRLLEPLPAQWTTVLGLLAQERVDVVVTDPLFLGASMLCLVPAEHRPPVIVLGVFPLPFPDPDVAPFGLGLRPLDSGLNRVRNLLLRGLVDGVLLRRVSRDLRRVAHELTGGDLRGGINAAPGLADTWAQLTVPRFEYPRARLPANVRFIGPLRPADHGRLPDWWHDRDDRPIVHVHHDPGTDPAAITVPAAEGLAPTDVQVVVTAGADAPAVAAMLDARGVHGVRVADAIPFAHLLPETAVMVTQGSYSTVQHALRWGVPVVVAGTAEEQVEVNARVAWTGVGVDLRSARPQPAAVRAAVERVLTEPAIRAATARIAAQIAATDARTELCEIAEALVARRDEEHRLIA